MHTEGNLLDESPKKEDIELYKYKNKLINGKISNLQMEISKNIDELRKLAVIKQKWELNNQMLVSLMVNS